MDHKKNQQDRKDSARPYLAPVSRTNDAVEAGISRRGFLGFAAASILLAHADQQSPQTESRNGIPYRTLANRRIPRRAFASFARASMRASIFSTTAGTTTAARVKSAWAMRCGMATAKKPF